MKLEELIQQVNALPVFDSKILMSGVRPPEQNSINVQMSRWVKSGKLIQLKRGLYLLPESYRKVNVYAPHISALLQKPSYLSLEKALEFHGLIPEGVSIYTSVTTKRPGRFNTPLGIFEYQHIQPSLFWGYFPVTVDKQIAFFATPEKALLDLVYLKWPEVTDEMLEEMRLQNLEKIRHTELLKYAKKFNKPKIIRAAKLIERFIVNNRNKDKTL